MVESLEVLESGEDFAIQPWGCAVITLSINGRETIVTAAPDTPLLWVLRDELNLTGSKYGCGMAQCGACTVQVDGEAQRSCVLPVAAVAGRKVTTIEGLVDPVGRAVQQAWRDLNVVQCGYCQSGQIMSATSLLQRQPHPTRDDIEQAMSGNLCRCATYQRIIKAVELAAKSLGG